MKNFRIFIILFCVCAFNVQSIKAQSFTEFFETLNEFNRIKKPEQNPRFESGLEMTRWDVQDRTNKIIGRVQDIYVTPNGLARFIEIKLNALGMQQNLLFEPRTFGLRPAESAYIFDIEEGQLQELYPRILDETRRLKAEFQRRPGDIFAMRDRLRNIEVKSEGGLNLGRVQNVLFDTTRLRAEGYTVMMGFSSVSGEIVVLPFRNLRFDTAPVLAPVLRLGDQESQTLIDYLRNR